MPPHKKIKLASKKQSSSPPPELDSDDASADEWADERQARQQFEQDDEEMDSEEEEDDGVAQFMDDEGEDLESDDAETSLGKQLSSIPFGSLLKATKKLKATAKRAQPDSDSDDDQPETSEAAHHSRAGKELGGKSSRPRQNKRANGSLMKVDRASKHAPMEMSSKRAVGRTRTIVETAANKARDPRFDSLSGNFKPDLFRTGYTFLAAAQTTELETLRKTAIAARKNPVLPDEEKEKIEAALTRMESREVSRKTKEREGEAMKKWKKDEAQKREGGKKEFYLKKSDQKAVLLKAKFDALSQDKKQLRKAVEKKRRTTAQKDKKLLPNRR